jgi:hypothetical protein
MASGSVTVVECLPHHRSIEGLSLSPVAGSGERIVIENRENNVNVTVRGNAKKDYY